MSVSLAPRPAHVAEDRVLDVNLHALPGSDVDPYAAWRQVGEWRHDVMWTPHNGGHWLSRSGTIIQSVYKDTVNFSNRAIALPPLPEKYRLSPNGDDGDEHKSARSLIMPFLTPQAVMRRVDEIREFAIRLIEDIKPRGKCEFQAEFGLVLPVEIFLKLVDLPASDRPRLRELAEAITRDPDPLMRDKGFEDTSAYLRDWLDRRRAAPGNDMLSAIATGTMFGAPITQDRAVRIALNVMLGGLDTVASMLGFIMRHLAGDPSARQWLRENPQRRARAIEELMRRHGLVNNLREAVADVEIDGATIRGGDHFYLITALHGLDDALFPDAMKVDLDRPPHPNVVFGAGAHQCSGASLARVEIGIVIEEWLTRIPDFRIADGDRARTHSAATNTMEYLPLEWDLGDR